MDRARASTARFLTARSHLIVVGHLHTCSIQLPHVCEGYRHHPDHTVGYCRCCAVPFERGTRRRHGATPVACVWQHRRADVRGGADCDRRLGNHDLSDSRSHCGCDRLRPRYAVWPGLSLHYLGERMMVAFNQRNCDIDSANGTWGGDAGRAWRAASDRLVVSFLAAALGLGAVILTRGGSRSYPMITSGHAMPSAQSPTAA